MSIFGSIKKSIGGELSNQMDRLRLMNEGTNLRVSLTKGDYSHRFYVVVDKLSGHDRETLDNLLTLLADLAEDDSEEITVYRVKNGKKMEVA